MQNIFVFSIIKSLHDLFTVLWIGGLLTTTFSLMPALKSLGLKKEYSKNLLINYQRRLRLLAIISVVVLWITGILLAKQSGSNVGFLNFSTQYQSLISIKHIIVIVMIVIAVFRGFVLGNKVENFTPEQQKTYAVLLLFNAFLGIVVLFLSGFSAAMV